MRAVDIPLVDTKRVPREFFAVFSPDYPVAVRIIPHILSTASETLAFRRGIQFDLAHDWYKGAEPLKRRRSLPSRQLNTPIGSPGNGSIIEDGTTIHTPTQEKPAESKGNSHSKSGKSSGASKLDSQSI